jgi:hypothetical protein
MNVDMPFAEVLDAADRLPLEDQEALIGILHRRLAEAGRRRVVADVKSGREEFEAGLCKPTSVDDLMGEVSMSN